MNPAPTIVTAPIERIGLLVNNNQVIESLLSALSSGTHAFELVPLVVEEIIDGRAWLDRITRNGERFTYTDLGDFRSFIIDPRPQGLGVSVEEVRKYLGDSSNPIRVKFEELLKKGQGGSRPDQPRTDDGSFMRRNDNSIIIADDSTSTPPIIRLRDEPEEPPVPAKKRRATIQGDSVGYAVRRLGRAAEDDPEKYGPVYDRLMAGEVSAHAAMIEVGFKPRTITIPVEPVAAWRLIVKHFHGEDLAGLIREATSWTGDESS